MLSIEGKKFLITGSSGQLAREFQKVLGDRKLSFAAPPEDQFDVTNYEQAKKVIAREKPDILVNCASFNLVDEAEGKPEIAFNINSQAVEDLARICKDTGIFLVHFSSDYVFDGKKTQPYTEDDQPNPLNVYGQSKLNGELAVRQTLEQYLIFRLSWVIGDGKQNFLYKATEWAKQKDVLHIVSDEVSVPTFTSDIVQATLFALEKQLTGLYHLTNGGQCSRYELAKYYFQRKGFAAKIAPVSSSYFKTKARRPAFSVMSNKKLESQLDITILSWPEGVDRLVKGT